jgi:hypothetical protein
VPPRSGLGGNWPGGSVRHRWQAGDEIIADGGDGLKGHGAGALDSPLVVLLEEDGADEAGDGGLVREDADDLGAALDLAVQALARIGRVQLRPVLPGKVMQASTSGSASSIRAASFGTLGRSRSATRRHCRLALPASFRAKAVATKAETTRRPLLVLMGEGVPHEMNAAALPGGAEHLGDRGLQPLVGIRDDELHPAQAAAGEPARGKAPQKGSASEGPMSIPGTSRRPSVFTPTATITATETIRPFWRALRQVASIRRRGIVAPSVRAR